jgi:hypothetical protein
MSIPVDPPDPTAEATFIANVQTMQQTGYTLEGDANSLQSDMDAFWQYTFAQGFSSLPACLQATLTQFTNQQNPIYKQLIAERIKLAQSLETAGDLIEAVDKAMATSFTDPTLSASQLNNLLPGLG